MEEKDICLSCNHRRDEIGESFADLEFVSHISQRKFESRKGCAVCGQALEKLAESDQANLFLSALNNQNLKVVAFTAPSIRTSLGEGFGMRKGASVTDKMVSALKAMGVDYVFDMNFGADLTTVEEATELIGRIKTQENLPMLSSCCPAWVSFVERAYPSLVTNLSTCKSPQQMMGAVLNTCFAEKLNTPNTNLFVVSIVPCVAKKLERLKPNINSAKGYDVDCTLTTIDIIDLIKLKNIDFKNLKPSRFDSDYGLSSGAGTIFGSSGGVMEAVLRSANVKDKKVETEMLTYDLVRGKRGVRELKFKAFGKNIQVACVSGLANAKPLLDEIMAGKSHYTFIEVMACDGGCVGGGGQPISEKREVAVNKRAEGLYKEALKNNHKTSFENPAIIDLYKNYLGEFGGERAKQLLHIPHGN